jgi:acyl carrier protein
LTGADEARLTIIFRAILKQPTLALRDDLTARDVTGWDSLNHVNLIIQIEQEFKIRFSNAEVSSLKNIGDMKRLIDAKLAGA